MRRSAFVSSAFVIGLTTASHAVPVDRIVGVDAPSGGALLIKRCAAPAGGEVNWITIKSNDPRTVFPKVQLLCGPLTSVLEGAVLAEARDVATDGHTASVSVGPVEVNCDELYVAVTMPASNGVVGLNPGAGIGGTLAGAGSSFVSAGPGATLQALEVSLVIDFSAPQLGKARGAGGSGAEVFETKLLAVGPSPARPGANVRFSLAREAHVRVVVYDVAGRQVRALWKGLLGAGRHVQPWDGKSDVGASVAAGIYLVELKADSKTFRRKLVVTK